MIQWQWGQGQGKWVSGKSYVGRNPPKSILNLEEAVETAKYAKHANEEEDGENVLFTNRVITFFDQTPSVFAFLEYFAVGTSGLRLNSVAGRAETLRRFPLTSGFGLSEFENFVAYTTATFHVAQLANREVVCRYLETPPPNLDGGCCNRGFPGANQEQPSRNLGTLSRKLENLSRNRETASANLEALSDASKDCRSSLKPHRSA